MESLFKLFETISPSGYQYKDKKSTHPFWMQEGGSDVSSYNDLTDLPKINGVELKGNKTSSQLHIITDSEVSSMINSRIANKVDRIELQSYYTKDETDAKLANLNFQKKLYRVGVSYDVNASDITGLPSDVNDRLELNFLSDATIHKASGVALGLTFSGTLKIGDKEYDLSTIPMLDQRMISEYDTINKFLITAPFQSNTIVGTYVSDTQPSFSKVTIVNFYTTDDINALAIPTLSNVTVSCYGWGQAYPLDQVLASADLSVGAITPTSTVEFPAGHGVVKFALGESTQHDKFINVVLNEGSTNDYGDKLSLWYVDHSTYPETGYPYGYVTIGYNNTNASAINAHIKLFHVQNGVSCNYKYVSNGNKLGYNF